MSYLGTESPIVVNSFGNNASSTKQDITIEEIEKMVVTLNEEIK